MNRETQACGQMTPYDARLYRVELTLWERLILLTRGHFWIWSKKDGAPGQLFIATAKRITRETKGFSVDPNLTVR